ncbi:HigA family addiction module antitoxin [Bacteroides sp. 224]|uniref:HigA family addiction module antitoxin n=1 Tax=Bacteroides sp. 224 TaxID=2302936 RepID=UPI0013D295E1|nr:HigA family addiction module antitoxin [Bacteroides sp. 224]NDV65420.1 addiction module antidote protein, HigA family [Bacteroides sp. 224]
MITLNGIDPKRIANNIIPFEPTHPGELLKDELHERGISQKRFAEVVDVPYTALNEILNGKRPMSVDFSLRVEAALNIEADLFINMQTRYNTQTARKDSNLSQKLEKIRSLCASLL